MTTENKYGVYILIKFAETGLIRASSIIILLNTWIEKLITGSRNSTPEIIIKNTAIKRPINNKLKIGIMINPEIMETIDILENNDAWIKKVTMKADKETDKDDLIFSWHTFLSISSKKSKYKSIPAVAVNDRINPVSNIQYGLLIIIIIPDKEIGVNFEDWFPE